MDRREGEREGRGLRKHDRKWRRNKEENIKKQLVQARKIRINGKNTTNKRNYLNNTSGEEKKGIVMTTKRKNGDKKTKRKWME